MILTYYRFISQGSRSHNIVLLLISISATWRGTLPIFLFILVIMYFFMACCIQFMLEFCYLHRKEVQSFGIFALMGDLLDCGFVICNLAGSLLFFYLLLHLVIELAYLICIFYTIFN